MSGSFAASLSFRRVPLAFGLCLLAFFFAVEAKTARYGPVAGAWSNVRAAKALPVASPRVVRHGVLEPDPAHRHIAFAAVAAIAAALQATFHMRADAAIASGHLPGFLAACFFPSSFIRPPPAL
jgi:hypothetical protein